MAILYLNGRRLFRGFLAGLKSVQSRREYLNRINVFPVPDGDTGANLTATLEIILQSSQYNNDLKATVVNLADNALLAARGNSGIIFSQYLYGLSRELQVGKRQTIRVFSEAVYRAVNYMYRSLSNPVEGTMITVIKDWAGGMLHFSKVSNDLHQVFENALKKAHDSLQKTESRLEVLRKAQVVDAGAMGFVLFLEGILKYLRTGILIKEEIHSEGILLGKVEEEGDPLFKYCCETLLTDSVTGTDRLTTELRQFGDSIAIAGGQQRLHLHIHCNKPTDLFHYLSQKATISNVKVDDMMWQKKIQKKRKFRIGLLTDSAADFPEDLREHYQIDMIPIKLAFGNDLYLDKVTIDPEEFFSKIEKGSVFPKTSQPDPAQVGSAVDFACSHFENLICISLSAKLSGINNLMKKAAGSHEGVEVFDSGNLSVSEGLLVLRTAEAIEKNMSFSEIVNHLSVWRNGTWIFTDIYSLDYMVRGGRVSPLKGRIANLLNLKPIVSVDKEGKGVAWGKSFSRRGNMKKIIRLIAEKAEEGRLWNYAIVHAKCPDRAENYARKLEIILKKKPLYIMEIGPVVGVHNGPGACAVGLLVEKE